MTDIAQLFDNLLDDVASGKRSPEECLALCQETYPELVSSLKLALALRTAIPNEQEIEAARVNARRKLDALLDQDEEASAGLQGIRVRPSPRRKTRWLVAALCAAVLALVMFGGWQLSTATASALPESPLYTIKRGDENIQLQLAWSSATRGDVLSMIALHRLDEARAEAARNNTSQALSLMGECDAATRQLIGLVITTQSQHQNDTALTRALMRTMQAEYDALQQERSNGASMMVQALTSTMTNQQSTLNASHIQMPPMATPVPVTPTQVAPPGAATHPAATPHPTQQPHATPTPRPTTQPNSKGNGGNSNGNSGSGNSSNSGNGAVNSSSSGSGNASGSSNNHVNSNDMGHGK